MGFLDHSTNNIILDAVLTDEGRRLLSANQGDFRVAYFSLADDEVDYSLITKFGRAIGKEKIMKNTPIFEAQTNGTIALKNRLLTLNDATIDRLPTMTAQVNGTSAVRLSRLNSNINPSSQTVSVRQRMVNGGRIPPGAFDTSVVVILPDRFVKPAGNKQVFAMDQITRMASYEYTMDDTELDFVVQVSNGLDDEMFDAFGDQGNKDQISSIITIVGNQTGFRKDIPVTITK